MIKTRTGGFSWLWLALLGLGMVFSLTGPALADDTMPIATARAAKDGTTATVQGSVTVGTKIFDATGKSFYLQDSSGGINIYFAKGNLPALVEGDTVKVSGKLVTFANHRELSPDDLTGVTKMSGAPTNSIKPSLIHTSEAPAHSGQLVQAQGQIVAGSTDFFTITDSTNLNQGDIDVYIYEEAGIGYNALASSQTVCVVGIVDPYNRKQELLPRSPKDIVNGNCPAANNIPAQGGGTGANSANSGAGAAPATGQGGGTTGSQAEWLWLLAPLAALLVAATGLLIVTGQRKPGHK